MQNLNREGGIIVNNKFRGLKFILVYDKFDFSIRISGEYISFHQRFQNILLKFIIVVHFFYCKKVC